MFSKYIIENFKKKLATYDKENWEVVIEKKQEKIINNLRSFENGEEYKISQLREDLIDVDLIRGSVFHKTKPSYDWLQVTRKALFRVILYPLYYSWWSQHLNRFLNFLFLSIYLIYNGLFLSYYSSSNTRKLLSFNELFSSTLSFFILGEVFIHAVCTNFSKPVIVKNLQNTTLNNAEVVSSISPNQNLNSNINSQKSSNKRSSLNKRHSYVENGKIIENPVRCDSKKQPIIIDNFVNGNEHVDKTKEVRFNMLYDEVIESDNNILRSNLGVISSADEYIAPTDNDSRASSSSMSENEMNRSKDINVFSSIKNNDTTTSQPCSQIDEKVMVSVWHGNICKKTRLTILEISTTIVKHVEIFSSDYDYSIITYFYCFLIGFLPIIYRLYLAVIDDYFLTNEPTTTNNMGHIIVSFIIKLFNMTRKECSFLLLLLVFTRLICTLCFMYMLIGAEHTYWERLLYAKYFGALTSTRRAKRNGLPHFRLHKVKNIKAWLSIRSFIRRYGPQRSMDTIVSATFLLSLGLVSVVCLQLIEFGPSDKHESSVNFFSSYTNWELFAECALSCFFLLRFMSLGSEINNKYRNYSVLLTEQMNLYLQMEQSPQKKEHYSIANNMLKLSCKLLKELERPFKVSGFIMNPLVRNVTRVVALSLFSGVISSLLGIRIKFWKIKIN